MNERILAPLFALAVRELVRFYRQPSRLVGALGSPLIFWLLIGSGFGDAFRGGGFGEGGYLRYFYPGSIMLVVMFTSIFSSISIIEDRSSGFLQSVLVSPASPVSIVGGKVLGGALLAWSQGGLFLLLTPMVGLTLSAAGTANALLAIFILAFTLAALGFAFAWRLESVQGFHGVMNLVLFPMWLLSGALFPIPQKPLWLAIPMLANPMTHGLLAFRASIDPLSLSSSNASLLMGPLLIVLLFGVLFFALSLWMVARRPKESIA